MTDLLILLLWFAGFNLLVGFVYPCVAVLVLRIMGDRRPLRELLSEI